jgi:nucleotide-binding universal stress UspA family protein
MYTKMLVPTDGSACSERAVDEAVRLAGALGTQVTFLCALDVLAVMRDGLVTASEIIDTMRAEATRAVARAGEVARKAGVVAHEEVAEGKPAEEIVKRATGFDLVVMGSHGKGFIKRLVLGSVTQAVLVRIDRPVLVINCKEHPASGVAQA